MDDLRSFFEKVLYLNANEREIMKTFIEDDNGNFSSPYLTIVSDAINTNLTIITLLALVNLLLVLPSNLLTVIVVIKNKELWTASNLVLSINGVVQALGSIIYLVARIMYIQSLLLLPSNAHYKDTVYLVGWLTCTIMMRTGNNRWVKRPMFS